MTLRLLNFLFCCDGVEKDNSENYGLVHTFMDLTVCVRQ